MHNPVSLQQDYPGNVWSVLSQPDLILDGCNRAGLIIPMDDSMPAVIADDNTIVGGFETQDHSLKPHQLLYTPLSVPPTSVSLQQDNAEELTAIQHSPETPSATIIEDVSKRLSSMESLLHTLIEQPNTTQHPNHVSTNCIGQPEKTQENDLVTRIQELEQRFAETALSFAQVCNEQKNTSSMSTQCDLTSDKLVMEKSMLESQAKQEQLKNKEMQDRMTSLRNVVRQYLCMYPS
jgi:hypothetical protein